MTRRVGLVHELKTVPATAAGGKRADLEQLGSVAARPERKRGTKQFGQVSISRYLPAETSFYQRLLASTNASF